MAACTHANSFVIQHVNNYERVAIFDAERNGGCPLGGIHGSQYTDTRYRPEARDKAIQERHLVRAHRLHPEGFQVIHGANQPHAATLVNGSSEGYALTATSGVPVFELPWKGIPRGAGFGYRFDHVAAEKEGRHLREKALPSVHRPIPKGASIL